MFIGPWSVNLYNPFPFLFSRNSESDLTILPSNQQIGIFGAFTIITTIHPELQGHKYRFLRTIAFVATGMSVVAPLIHGLDMFGLDLMNKKALTHTMAAKAGCLLSGTALYAVSLPLVSPTVRERNCIESLTCVLRKTRFPERWWPERFDMCSSHSLMHILVVCAAVIQMVGYLEAFDYAYSNITCLAS